MKKIARLVCLLLCVVLATALFAACAPEDKTDVVIDPDTGELRPSDTVAKVTFWFYGDNVERGVFESLVESFNKANKGIIEVEMVPRPADSYEDSVRTALSGNKLDVFYVGDSGYKSYAENGLLLDLTDYIGKSKVYRVEDMWKTVVTRYKYDVNTKLSATESGRYYGVPKDIGPTVIYYNETHFKEAGVTVISVDANDLDDYNNGAADARGNTKSDVGIASDYTVKQKGYFVDSAGKKFFNNKIPMNWDETVELSTLVQNVQRQKGNNAAYGYFTEWWFNYGWTVGGDCIQYIPTSDSDYTGGYYDFTLMDPTPNYIVADDCAEGVTVHGTHYNAGEIISYTDKLGVEAVPTAGYNYSKEITPEVLALVESGDLLELPSQREAFTYFVCLGSKSGTTVDEYDGVTYTGYGITPQPSSIGTDAGKVQEFTSGNISMLVDGRWDVTRFREEMEDEWDVAPLPMYKEYYEQGDTIPAGKEVGDVKVHGVEAGHSGSVGLCINKKSQVPAASWKFIEYIGGTTGQTLQAQAGFAIPLQIDLANSEVFLQSDKDPKNAEVFIRAAEIEKAGDWWYLSDKKWIDDWAGVLNGDVRNGDKTMSEFEQSYEYTTTYTKLLDYTKVFGD